MLPWSRYPAPSLILAQPDALDDLAVLHAVGRDDVELGHRLPANEAGTVLLLHHPGTDVDAREYLRVGEARKRLSHPVPKPLRDSRNQVVHPIDIVKGTAIVA